MESILLLFIALILAIIAFLIKKVNENLSKFHNEIGQSHYNINEQIKGLWRVIKYYDLKAKEEKKEI